MSAVFITGTGTDVGKTFVAAGLIRCLRNLGQRVNVLKPVASGFDPAAPSGSDPALLLEALGRDVNAAELQRISPWRFRAPVSPDMAAYAEGKAIDFAEVIDFCSSAIAHNTGALLIEGVGGVMVPLDTQHTVLDVMVALQLPVILVAGSYVGTLNHTLCSQDVILRQALDLRAIVVSETVNAGVSLEATLSSLANFTRAALFGLRRQDGDAQNATVFQQLAKIIA
ncbi:dethiobiotin synthase [Methylocapsa sp. D3K7]|uniref:dethiobiotin synthase n=1 Tax=Methylocapsa sp. D3K7 TaxID=3041435 RepID=UPI00244E9019|nr:dethiobiotin synthase [Methylocapsa sp. D3K7]WGJ15364.1 dethiobiotin synthase [Methylocapsa sp. D3K7]